MDEELQKPEPVKRVKAEKPSTNIVLPPKVVTKPVDKKVPIQKEPPKVTSGYYNFSENPFGIEGFDPKRVISHPFPLEFLLSQNKQSENNLAYLPANYDFMVLLV